MKFKGFEIKSAANNADIYLYGMIGRSFFDPDAIAATEFIAQLKNLKDVETINLYINSPGGDVFDGNAIYNALQRHKLDNKISLHVHIDALAASMASIIAMAGDTVNMAENGLFMIHDPWTCMCGTADDLRASAEVMDKLKDGMLNIYEAKASIARDELSEAMKSETWYTASEAEDAGFIDKVTKAAKIAALANVEMFGFKNMPDRLKEAKPESTDTEKTEAAIPLAVRRRRLDMASRL